MPEFKEFKIIILPDTVGVSWTVYWNTEFLIQGRADDIQHAVDFILDDLEGMNCIKERPAGSPTSE